MKTRDILVRSFFGYYRVLRVKGDEILEVTEEYSQEKLLSTEYYFKEPLTGNLQELLKWCDAILEHEEITLNVILNHPELFL